ncbi:MAG TPA: hypothetical protein VLT45_06315 [Kofleriaceae bacterium]|nr:hypothetical protein [Kofleriaceae bacterium]
MKTSRRSAKKLVLPLIAVGMMTAAMAYDGSHRSHPGPAHAPTAAARVATPHTR